MWGIASVRSTAIGTITALLVCSGPVAGQTARELDRKSGGSLFARMWRTAACTNEQVKNPRCPSIVRNSRGELLLMFTDGATTTSPASLGLAKSGDEGKSWSAGTSREYNRSV